MNTFLITGASGLLSREFIKQALEADPDTRIIGLSHSREALEEAYPDAPQLSFFSWDELDEVPFDQVTCILHCAFARTEQGPDLQKSLVCTEQLLEKTAAYKIPLINISSRGVYGQNPNVPWTEETQATPASMYALAKCAQELLASQAAALSRFPCTTIRLAGLMGIGMDARLISKLVLQAVQSNKLSVVGGGQQFALLDIRDAAAGLLALTKVPAGQWDPVYNLGAVSPYTLDEITMEVKMVAQRKYQRKVAVFKTDRDVSLIDAMDCSRFYAATGWTPSYSLEDTICTLFDYYIEAQ